MRPEVNGMAQAVAEAFEQERQTNAGAIAALRQQAQSAQDAAAAAVARADALAMQLEQSVGVSRSAITQVEHDVIGAAPSALAVDGWRLVLRCADGREFTAELPRPDLDAVAVLVVERHLDRLRGEKGERGEEGAAAVIDLAELGAVLRSEASFLESIRGDPGKQGEPGPPGESSEPWCTGVHREGTRRSHFLGRVYRALRDTAEEPGDSADWQRIDTAGLRHIGPAEPRERGDIHIKEGATFLYDGGRSWLLSAKAFSTGDGERLINPLRDGIKGLRERCAANEARTQTVAELARAADANAGEALRWIASRAEALDALLDQP